jgi:hypothetical protein
MAVGNSAIIRPAWTARNATDTRRMNRSAIVLERTNLLGALVAVAIYALYIGMCILRLLGRPQAGHLVASAQFLAVLPLCYLLLKAPQLQRSVLYDFQIGLMLVFLVVEFLLDYVLKLEFRQVRWMVIGYVTLFFAATGGLLGVAASAGRTWTIAATTLFLIMAVLAFVQRAVTGM